MPPLRFPGGGEKSRANNEQCSNGATLGTGFTGVDCCGRERGALTETQAAGSGPAVGSGASPDPIPVPDSAGSKGRVVRPIVQVSERVHVSAAAATDLAPALSLVRFPADCLDCQCTGAEDTDAVPNSHGRTSATRAFPDHADPLFEEKCRVNTSVIAPPSPRAIRRMQWLHIPKCGTSLSTVLYNVCSP